MSSLALPPNPCLIAVILITKTREGVKHVFHYPPNPGPAGKQSKLDEEVSDTEATSSTHDSDESDSSTGSGSAGNGDRAEDAQANSRLEGGTALASSERHDHRTPREQQQQQQRQHTPANATNQSKETILGLPQGFEKFLCPPSAYHKRRFEVGIGQLAFLGWPVFAHEDGEWRRRKRRRASSKRRSRSTEKSHAAATRPRMSPIRERAVTSSDEEAESSRRTALAETEGEGEDGGGGSDEDLGETTGNESFAEAPVDANTDEPAESVSTEKPSADKDAANDHEGKAESNPSASQRLHMFHVVFVLHPPPLEYQVRVDDMYKHIVKKFSRALKWEQTRSNFVQRECEKLKAMKAKKDPSSEHILRSSSLARAIATIYTSVSTSRIANIDLTPHVSFSLQIPLPTSITHLPELGYPQVPGLWLTTATTVPASDDLQPPRPRLASHFGLLLLADPASILAEISPLNSSSSSAPPPPSSPPASTSALYAPLAHYLRHTTPTKSFLQVSQLSGISLNDIHSLASHLIYWRKARAIPPLHQRDVYIVSPNADMRRLRSARAQFARTFPALPPLPKILAQLSSGTRPFAAMIPSKDHKPAYFAILAWLMRGGWVTQLRAFGWVRVSEAIQVEVARKIEMEKRKEGDEVPRHQDEVDEDNATATAAAAAAAAAKPGTATNDAEIFSKVNRFETGRQGPVDGTRWQQQQQLATARSKRSDSLDDTSSNDAGDQGGTAPSSVLLSPLLSSTRSIASSVSSTRTAIPLAPSLSSPSPRPGGPTAPPPQLMLQQMHLHPPNAPLRPNNTEESRPSTSANAGAGVGAAVAAAHVASALSLSPKIILSPRKASGIESRYLEHIADTVERQEGRESRDAWQRCLRYFDGEHALEMISVDEGWKRKKAEGFRAAWVRMGILMEVRHW